MTSLVIPDRAHLDAYAAALHRGWSPNTTRDVSGEHLAAIAEDADGFLGRLVQPAGCRIMTASGDTVIALPGTTRWIWANGFCGAINFRYQPGTTALPPHVSGHIGYSVVSWRQRLGHATAALRLMLPMAAAAGLPEVIVTCNTDNAGSRKVIESAGGRFLDEVADDLDHGARKFVFRIAFM